MSVLAWHKTLHVLSEEQSFNVLQINNFFNYNNHRESINFHCENSEKFNTDSEGHTDSSHCDLSG